MNVVKRDGRLEPLNICKIKKYTSTSVAGLSGVCQGTLELDAKIHFVDGIKTSDIQKTLIETAVDKIDVDAPNWTFVASRLFIYDLYHRVSDTNEYPTLKEYLDRGVKCNRIIDGLADMYDLDRLNKHIKPERDMEFNYLGIKTLYDRYLLKYNGNPIELPQHMFMGIAMFLAQNEIDKNKWAIEFYDMISTFKVMLATPTLSNARTPRHQLSSCYIGSTPDAIEGIFDSYSEMGMLSKFGGGIGWDWTSVRSMGSMIDGHHDAAGGTIPFIHMTNSLSVAVDQLGTRKGAIAVYMEPWHIDINNFLDLKKNSGEERRRAHDLFPALWLNDMFMERVTADMEWSLFDPYEATILTETYGDEFNDAYLKLEQDDTIKKEKISAKDLWKKILRSYFETGSPFLAFKDTANRSNPNSHAGIIRSSNLCTEIFQNTSPNKYNILIRFENGDTVSYGENEMVTLDSGVTKPAKRVTSLDKLGGLPIYVVEKEKIDGETAVCNLASVNLSRVNTKKEIEEIVPIAVRCLDNVIDLNFYPIKKVKDTNMKSRAIGLGAMGEAELLAVNGIEWGTTEHFNKIDELMEAISYMVIHSSSRLADERGKYPLFEGSNWSKGIMPMDHASEAVRDLTTRELSYDWDMLRDMVKTKGVRNGYMMSIAPTSSISILTGTTQTIEPVYKRKWYEENLSGLIPVVVPKLSPDTWNYYTSAYDLNQTLLIKAGAIRQKYIDQGESLNIFITLDVASGKYLNEIYMLAWKLGLKSVYYLRSESPDTTAQVADRSMECTGCQ